MDRSQENEPKSPCSSRSSTSIQDSFTSYKLEAPKSIQDVDAPSVEYLAERLFSSDHLHLIIRQKILSDQFLSFVERYLPQCKKTLCDYIDCQKILAMLGYANALSDEILPGLSAASPNTIFQERVQDLTDKLVQEALPAFVTHQIASVITSTLSDEVLGKNMPVRREVVGGGVESFCLSDPSQPDNPIVFTSEEFCRTTQYGIKYVTGRNCRILQGPDTSPQTKERITKAMASGSEVQDIILNYHRDGSPFINLLTIIPLVDNKGRLRYYIGAQIDITKLVENGKVLESSNLLMSNDLAKKSTRQTTQPSSNPTTPKTGRRRTSRLVEFTQLMNLQETSIVRRGTQSRLPVRVGSSTRDSGNTSMILNSPSSPLSSPLRRQTDARITIDSNDDGAVFGSAAAPSSSVNRPSLQTTAEVNALSQPQPSTLSTPTIFSSYLLVRPWPDHTITFVSPNLRTPGIVQSSFISHLGGSRRSVRGIKAALKEGSGVSGPILWLPFAKAGGIEDGVVDHPSLRGRGRTVAAAAAAAAAATATAQADPGRQKSRGGSESGRDSVPRSFISSASWRTVHCTPLFGSDSSNNVGVWMILLLDMSDASSDIPNPRAATPETAPVQIAKRPLSTERPTIFFWGQHVTRLPDDVCRDGIVVQIDPITGMGIERVLPTETRVLETDRALTEYAPAGGKVDKGKGKERAEECLLEEEDEEDEGEEEAGAEAGAGAALVKAREAKPRRVALEDLFKPDQLLEEERRDRYEEEQRGADRKSRQEQIKANLAKKSQGLVDRDSRRDPGRQQVPSEHFFTGEAYSSASVGAAGRGSARQPFLVPSDRRVKRKSSSGFGRWFGSLTLRGRRPAGD